MANYSNTRIQRLYVQPEATWRTIPNTAGVASLAGSNCCRMSSLAINQTQQEVVRSDKTGSLGITMGILGRRQATWSTKMSMASNGAVGVKPDMDPFLAAIMGKLATVSAGVSVTYGLDDSSPSVTIWDFNTPSTMTERLILGCIASKAKFDIGIDEPAVEFSGPGLAILDTDIFATADTISKGSLIAFPTEPATPVTNGTAPPGFTGLITLDANTYATFRSGSISLDVDRELPMDGFNSYYGLAPAVGLRNVAADWSMYDDDSAMLSTLKVKAYNGTGVTLTFQIGTVAGSIWTFTLKNVLLSKPTFDYSGKRRIVSFSACRAHDTTIGAIQEQLRSSKSVILTGFSCILASPVKYSWWTGRRSYSSRHEYFWLVEYV
jgi:hypothetical protein